LYSLIHKKEAAHDERIWSVSWQKSKTETEFLETDFIVTGGIDDSVKVLEPGGTNSLNYDTELKDML